MASKNSQDAISLVQTAEGALQTSHDILQRMRELAVQAASDSNQTTIDREALNTEFQQLIKEINDTAEKTTFNNMKLIDGSFGSSAEGKVFTAQSGANMGDELKLNIENMDWNAITTDSVGTYNFTATTDLGTALPNFGNTPADGHNGQNNPKAVNVQTQAHASKAIDVVDAAINEISSQRSELGAMQNRLEFKIQNLDISAENLQAAESRIRDVDMAKEMTAFTKSNILFQASTAMLAQANALPQGVLQLLGGAG